MPLPRVELVMARRVGRRAAAATGALAVAVGWLLGRDGSGLWWTALRGAAVFALAVVTMGVALRAVRPPRLVLDATGLTVVGVLRVVRSETWEDCVRFSPVAGVVGFQTRAYRQAPDEQTRRRMRGALGYPATVVPGYGGLEQARLCSLLNRYRETFSDLHRRSVEPAGPAVVDLTAAERPAPSGS